MSKYIVTGGAGFIGSHLAEALLDDGHRVVILDNLSTGKKSNIPKKAEFHKVDIRNLEKISPFFKGVDGVFHLAAIPSVPYSVEHPVESFRVNVDGTLHILASAKDAGVKRVVFSSSAATYGAEKKLPHHTKMVPRPMNPYALHKAMGEALLEQFASLYDLETVSLRYFNAYGPRMADVGAYVTVISIFSRLKKAGKPLMIQGDGKQTRDFVHVRDIVSANILAMQSKKVGKGEILNVGTGKEISVNQIAKIIGGKTKKMPARPTDITRSVAEISETTRKLGWKPRVDFKDGIRETLEWLGIVN